MGGEGLPDHQAMLKKVQQTDHITSMEEQAEVERAGWDINSTEQHIHGSGKRRYSVIRATTA